MLETRLSLLAILGMSQYRAVWQTWKVVDSTAEVESKPVDAPCEAEGDFRHRVQTARVQRRWSIADLASKVGCPVDRLVEFERGEDVLDEVTKDKVRNALNVAQDGIFLRGKR